MKHRIMFAVLVAGSLLGLAGRRRPSSIRAMATAVGAAPMAAAALLGADYRQATAMQLKAQSMQAGQQAAMAQNYVVQSGIRNTLSSQAQSRDTAILNQQQANQDWWFQQQSQQWPSAGPGRGSTALRRFRSARTVGRTASGGHGHHQVADRAAGPVLCLGAGHRSRPRIAARRRS